MLLVLASVVRPVTPSVLSVVAPATPSVPVLDEFTSDAKPVTESGPDTSRLPAVMVEIFALETVALSTSIVAISSLIAVETIFTNKIFAERFSIYASLI